MSERRCLVVAGNGLVDQKFIEYRVKPATPGTRNDARDQVKLWKWHSR